MWQCRPLSSSCGWPRTRATACWADPSVRERPNFCPSVPVRIFSCPCGGDPRHHPHHDLLPTVGADQRGDSSDLRGAVEDDPPDPEPQRGLDVARALRVSVQHHPLRRKPGQDGEFEFTGGADVEPQTLLVDPPNHRPGQERLGGVQHIGVGEGGPVRPAPCPHLVLVQHIRGGVEPVGHIGERDPADTQISVRETGGGGRPHGQVVQSGRELGENGSGHGGISSGDGYRNVGHSARTGSSAARTGSAVTAGAERTGSRMSRSMPRGAASERSAGSESLIED